LVSLASVTDDEQLHTQQTSIIMRNGGLFIGTFIRDLVVINDTKVQHMRDASCVSSIGPPSFAFLKPNIANKGYIKGNIPFTIDQQKLLRKLIIISTSLP
jgi:hypothetical protein